MSLPTPKLRIRPLNQGHAVLPDLWLFLDYGRGEYEMWGYRWAIHRFDFADGGSWWGVRALMQDTHENAIDLIGKELELAKEAIGVLKAQWQSGTRG